MDNSEFATLGGGCLWCVEAIYQRVSGVLSVKPGYAGGDVKNPTYKQVCSGKTGHAEVARIEYNPSVITYKEILNVFWQCHDPTTLNRQGNDVGSQYRSVIYYQNDQQKVLADESKTIADQSDYWSDPIVTEIVPLMNYFEAEDYHHDYYNNNPNQPYCIFVIKPKLDKLKKNRIIDLKDN
jgi:peptide-methionine (S)-S-oxide reductase